MCNYKTMLAITLVALASIASASPTPTHTTVQNRSTPLQRHVQRRHRGLSFEYADRRLQLLHYGAIVSSPEELRT
ncbi:hypothetical protein B0H11DRAFT_2215591 [Mycena galericulata]|nr:hypothetical protein B0H11DRAFT_2215591 [Mycena galericulata]